MKAAPPCTASQLQVSAVSDASLGPATAVIELSDSGDGRCVLQGYLGLSLPDQGGHILNVEVVHRGLVGSNGFRGGHVATHPQAVVLQPAQPDAAWIAIQWNNWCGSSAVNLGLKLILRDGDQLPIAQQGLVQGLRCVTASAPSVLDEGPVQTPVG